VSDWRTILAVTYSIVGVDLETAQVGGAGVSCVGSLPVRVIYGVVPGTGAVHAQARLGERGKATAVMMLEDGAVPADIIATITMTSFDADAASRQYGIVDVRGNAAGFTGAQNGTYADDVQATHGTFVYSVQGNILTSERVIEQATDAFAGAGCDLADRLVLALEAGAANGEGDSRCTPSLPGDSAFLQVDLPGQPEGTFLRIEAIDTAPQDPIAIVRAQYAAWRAEHPCPAPPPPADGSCHAGGAEHGMLLVVLVVLAMKKR
jgi:uncharacterized Ntn-hydrolase superfamily protein